MSCSCDLTPTPPREVVFFIRPRCTEPSISRGTFHKLADEGKVAWHPEDAANSQPAARTSAGGQAVKPWATRPTELAYLFNPAYCGWVLA